MNYGQDFRSWKKKARHVVRRWAARRGWGRLPDFLIVGGQRCGTTSLYHYLRGHPQVLPALQKEVHYFDENFDKDISWYQAFFPVVPSMDPRRMLTGGRYLTGEASPYYMFHPHAPRRIAQLVPDCKIIALVRDPVERAYSHFTHKTRNKVEQESFEQAIERELGMIDAEEAKLTADETYHSFAHRKLSYLSRGVYHRQIARLFGYFGRRRVLVICSEDLFSDPGRVVAEALRFIGVDDLSWTPSAFPKRNFEGQKTAMKPETREFLVRFFHTHNEHLSDLLGRTFPWQQAA